MYYKISCPVPKRQRPINEYMDLVQSSFFNWPIQASTTFQNKLLKSFLFFFVVVFPFSKLFYTTQQALDKLVILTACFACFFVFLVLLRLFLGWTYIKKRLYNPCIFYEESGWYDGRMWVKSKKILVQDRLIYTYQVLPAIKSLKKALVLSLCLLSSLIFLLIFN